MVKPFYLTITTFLEGGFLWLNKEHEKQKILLYFLLENSPSFIITIIEIKALFL
jgi:hypothetical protein